MKPRNAAAAAVSAAMAIAACRTGTPAAGVAPPANRPAAAAPVSDADVAQGRALAAALFGRDPLVPDSRLLRYVALVGRAVAGAGRADSLHFGVTQSDLPYETAFPGGIVVISRGLIFEMDSEAELAVTLGREICRLETGAARDLPGGPENAEPARESALDACGGRRASAAGYDAAAFLQLVATLQDRAASVREKSDLEARRAEFRKLPESAAGGKLLADRFRRSAIM
jgi:predicted Zn-dependent protease